MAAWPDARAHVIKIKFILQQNQKKNIVTIPEALIDELLDSFLLATSLVKFFGASQVLHHCLQV